MSADVSDEAIDEVCTHPGRLSIPVAAAQPLAAPS